MKKHLKYLLTGLAAAALVACGGGVAVGLPPRPLSQAPQPLAHHSQVPPSS